VKLGAIEEIARRARKPLRLSMFGEVVNLGFAACAVWPFGELRPLRFAIGGLRHERAQSVGRLGLLLREAFDGLLEFT
jgi:hypothetical protein